MATVDNLIAKRGNTWLTTPDLQAHLATLLRLENVGLLLGAGASAGGTGGKTVREIWDAYSAAHPDIIEELRSNHFLPPPGTPGAPGTPGTPNIERLLDNLELAILEANRTKTGARAKELQLWMATLQRDLVESALLNRDWWTDPAAIPSDAEALDNHSRLLLKIIATRAPGQSSPWIFTTNYDLVVEWAAETIGIRVVNGFEGIHYRAFSSPSFDLAYRNVLARGEARFGTYNIYLVKLHGSLSWSLNSSGELIERPSHAMWHDIERFLDQASDSCPAEFIYPSGSKHLHTASYELGELVRRFSEFLARPQSCLITSGYSFSDEHLNRVLMGGLQNPTLQLIIYFPEAMREDDNLRVSTSSPWMERIVRLQSPQVTIVGGGATAYFEGLVQHIPDPAIFDTHAAEIRGLIREFRKADDKGSAS